MAKFEVFQGEDEKWYWHLKAANGEIVGQSEGYESKGGAEHAIEAIKSAVLDVILADASAIELKFVGRQGGSPAHVARVAIAAEPEAEPA